MLHVLTPLSLHDALPSWGRVPGLPARRVRQPDRRDDRPGDPPGRDDDRGGGNAVALRPRPGTAERALRDERGWQTARGLPPRAGRLQRPACTPGDGDVGPTAGTDTRPHTPRPRGEACGT